MHLDQVLMKRQFEDGLAMRISNTVLEHPDCEVLISGERTESCDPERSVFRDLSA